LIVARFIIFSVCCDLDLPPAYKPAGPVMRRAPASSV
jgi:hypothetical protein